MMGFIVYQPVIPSHNELCSFDSKGEKYSPPKTFKDI